MHAASIIVDRKPDESQVATFEIHRLEVLVSLLVIQKCTSKFRVVQNFFD